MNSIASRIHANEVTLERKQMGFNRQASAEYELALSLKDNLRDNHILNGLGHQGHYMIIPN